jgi:hypothetical protein
MAKFKLIPYRIRLKKIDNNEEISNLSDIDGNHTDFLNLFESYLRAITEAKILTEEKRTMYINQIGRDGRDLFGLAESGEYGLSANFVNVNTREITPLARMPHHSEAYPFLFYIRIPQDSNMGLLILEKYRTVGIKTNFQYIINEKLNSIGYELKLSNLISRDLLDLIEQSKILELKLIRYDVPMDVAERVHNGPPREIKEMHIFEARRNREISLTQQVKDILFSERITNYYEVLDERYDEIKVLINRGRDTKTLTFGDNEKCLESMPLNPPSDGSFPTYNQLLLEARSYLGHLQTQVGG